MPDRPSDSRTAFYRLVADGAVPNTRRSYDRFNVREERNARWRRCGCSTCLDLLRRYGGASGL